MKRKKCAGFLIALVLFLVSVISIVSRGRRNSLYAGDDSTFEKQSFGRQTGEYRVASRQANPKIREEYPVLDWDGRRSDSYSENYILLQDMEKEKHYQVKEGDTLWGIAYEFYETGNAWPVLKEANREQIRDENLIFPGTELTVPRNCLIRRQSFSRGGFSSSACSYDVPWSWVAGRPNWEVCLEYSWFPEEGNYGVYTHVTENRLFPEGIGDAWESVQQKIIEIAEENNTVSFSIPVFERYRREDGRELLFYQFIAMAQEEKIQFAVAYVPGKEYLAEFIGICPLTDKEEDNLCDIVGITRYMAASYEEEGGEKEWNSLKYRPYLGEENWLFEDLHNPFAIAAERFGEKIEARFDGPDGEVHFVSAEWEELLRKMVCYHFDYSSEEITEFMKRPVYLSELAWIEEIKLVESPIPGRDKVVIQGLCPPEGLPCNAYNLTTLADIAVLPNLQSLTLEIGTAEDYEQLAYCPSLRELSITGQSQMKEADWLLELPNLESLTLNVSYIPHLLAMGVEMEDGTTFSEGGKTENEETGEKGLDEILGECPLLTYLELEYAGELDYDFLDNLPLLYTFILKGREEEESRKNVFAKESYPQIKCLVVDRSWVRNPA